MDCPKGIVHRHNDCCIDSRVGCASEHEKETQNTINGNGALYDPSNRCVYTSCEKRISHADVDCSRDIAHRGNCCCIDSRVGRASEHEKEKQNIINGNGAFCYHSIPCVYTVYGIWRVKTMREKVIKIGLNVMAVLIAARFILQIFFSTHGA